MLKTILTTSTLLLLASCELISPEIEGGPCEYQDFDGDFKAELIQDDIFQCTSLKKPDVELIITRAEMYDFMNDSLIGVDSTELVIKGSYIVSGSCSPESIEGIRKK